MCHFRDVRLVCLGLSSSRRIFHTFDCPLFTSCFSPQRIWEIHGLMFNFTPNINVELSVSHTRQLNVLKCDFSREWAWKLTDKNYTKSKFRDSVSFWSANVSETRKTDSGNNVKAIYKACLSLNSHSKLILNNLQQF